MTPSLLEHPLIKKYFSCEAVKCYLFTTVEHNCFSCLAHRVLDAMQQPKKEGDRCLRWNNNNNIVEEIVLCDHDGFQPSLLLRLPDAFQKKEHVCDCEFCGHPDTIHIPATKKECDHIGGGFVVSNTSVIRCMRCTQVVFPAPEPAPDKAVEEKIKSVSGLMTRTYEQGYVSRIEIENELKALITLARRQK